VNELGGADPGIAKSWESPDKGKTWIFTIKEGLRWHDGEPVDSSTVVYEFSDVSVENPSENTIMFNLQEPFTPFPLVVSKPTFKKGLLGTGLWKVDKISISGGYVHDLRIVDKENNKILYKFYPSVERTKLAYKLGEVDSIVRIIDPTPFDGWNNVVVEKKVDEKQVVTLFFNTKDDILADKSIRQALNYAINKKSLGERAYGPISPTSWSYNSQIKKYEYDVERAKSIFEDNDIDPASLDIQLVSTPLLLGVAENISENWKEIGIESNVLVSSVIPEDFQAYLTIYDIPTDPDQYPIWHSTQTFTNLSRYFNQRIDKLLEEGRTQLKIEDRKKTYLDFQRFLLEDVPAAFLYHPTYYDISRK
jgi:peptide/nickel transport system substrate-binding protein